SRAGQAYHPVLGGGIGVGTQPAHDAGDAGHREDDAALLLAHGATGVLDAIEHAVEQHRLGRTPVRRRGFQNAADGADHTGVVDHAVDVAELLQRRPDQRLDSRLAGDIGAHETTTDLLRHPDTTLDVDIRHHHA